MSTLWLKILATVGVVLPGLVMICWGLAVSESSSWLRDHGQNRLPTLMASLFILMWAVLVIVGGLSMVWAPVSGIDFIDEEEGE